MLSSKNSMIICSYPSVPCIHGIKFLTRQLFIETSFVCLEIVHDILGMKNMRGTRTLAKIRLSVGIILQINSQHSLLLHDQKIKVLHKLIQNA